MATRVAFIGLGVMGAPMAGHLARAGADLSVYNRSRTKVERWIASHPGRAARSPADCARDAEVVISCVGNDDDLRAIAYGESGMLAVLGAGQVWVDHTTASATVARELAHECAARGAAFLDAPVSGGESGAQRAQLSVMVGGSIETLEAVRPLLSSYGKRIELIGPSGHGQLAKMVNQICIAGLLQALSEGLHFGERAGLDMEKVLEVISQGAAQSWQMNNRGRTMLDRRFDFGFAVDWMSKDLDLCFDEASRNGAQLEVTRRVGQRYQSLRSRGHGQWDTSSLITLLDEVGGDPQHG